jgi:hypothetical protein
MPDMLALAMSSVKRGSYTDALCLHKSICIADSFHRAKPVNRDEAKRNRGSTAESRSLHSRLNEPTVSRIYQRKSRYAKLLRGLK